MGSHSISERRASAAAFMIFILAVLLAPLRSGYAVQAENPLEAVVRIEARVPADARTAPRLGTQRAGAGVVIADNGLIVTIGYLVMEADEVTVTDRDGRRYPAEVVGYDHATGFGVLRAHKEMKVPFVALGDSSAVAERDPALAASVGPVPALPVRIRSVREFAGGWEYLLDEAIFTSPPIPEFGGAALFGVDGSLLAVGSLYVGDADGDGSGLEGNMFVPIDLLKPLLSDLLAFGRSERPARPWVGIYPAEISGVVVISRVAEGGPAAAAGLARGDILVAVGEVPVKDMAGFFREIWALGPAGTEIPLTVLRGGAMTPVTVKSRDRLDWLKLNPSY